MTLIELTVATAILSVMLLGLTQYFINLIHENRAEVSVQDSTQNVRYALDDISSEARLASSVYVVPNTAPGPANSNQICLYEANSMVQYYAIQPPGNYHQILYKHVWGSIADIPTGNMCPVRTIVDNTDINVMSDSNAPGGSTIGLNVVDFRAFTTVGAATTAVPTLTVRLGVTSNLTNLNTGNVTQCKAGTEVYCSVTSIETTVSLRSAQSTGP